MRRCVPASLPFAMAKLCQCVGLVGSLRRSGTLGEATATNVALLATTSPTRVIPRLLFQTFASPLPAEHKQRCAVLLCTWSTSNASTIVLRDMHSDARLAVGVAQLGDQYGAWFQAHFPLATHSVWFVPNLASPQGVALQTFLREGSQKRVTMTNAQMAKKRRVWHRGTTTNAPAATEGEQSPLVAAWIPEEHRALVSLRQLLKLGKLQESAWALTSEAKCLELIRHLEARWTELDWEAALNPTHGAVLSSMQPTAGPGVGRPTVKPPSGPSVGPTPSRSSSATSSATKSAADTVSETFRKVSALCNTLVTGSASKPREDCVVLPIVVGVLRSNLHMTLFDNPAPLSVDKAREKIHHPGSGVVTSVPLFFTASATAIQLLREGDFLQASSARSGGKAPQLLRTVRPHLVRLADLEVAVHSAVRGFHPKKRAVAETPPVAAGGGGDTPAEYDVDRAFSWRAVGASKLVELALANLTMEEWRRVVLRGSDLTSIKSHDVSPERLEKAVKHQHKIAAANRHAAADDAEAAVGTAAARPHNAPPPSLRTLPNTERATTIRPGVSASAKDLGGHMQSIYGCPVRRVLEYAALRGMLPAKEQQGTAPTRHVLVVKVESSGCKGEDIAGRSDNPFNETNRMVHVAASGVRFAPPMQASTGGARHTLPTVVSSRAKMLPSVEDAHTVWHTGGSVVSGKDAEMLDNANVVVMADAKRGLVLLRNDPLFRRITSPSATGIEPLRLWCVLYAQHVLSGFREKYTSVHDVLRQYTSTTGGGVPNLDVNDHLQVLAYIYEQQVTSAALGRVLLALRTRMDGLLASTIMEVNGIAVAPQSEVDNALQQLQTDSARVDTVLSTYIGTVLTGPARVNFNWRAPQDTATALYGGGLLRLAGKFNPLTVGTSTSSPAPAAATTKPVLHRFLIEAFGVPSSVANIVVNTSPSDTAGQGAEANLDRYLSQPPAELYRPDALSDAHRQRALAFLSQRTSFVVLSLHLGAGERVVAASVFVPCPSSWGGGVHIAARIVCDEVRGLVAASHATVHHRPLLPNTFKHGVQVEEQALPLMSLQEFRKSIQTSDVLRTMREEAATAELIMDAREASDDEMLEPHVLQRKRKNDRVERRLPGHPLQRISGCPPNVVFICNGDEVEKQARHAIQSTVAQAVCEALEISSDERVGFVGSSVFSNLRDGCNAPPISADAGGGGSSVPNFAKDFENLEKGAGAFSDAQSVWLEEVLGCSETMGPSERVRQPGVGAARHLPNGDALWLTTKERMLAQLHDATMRLWSSTSEATSAPYVNLMQSNTVPRKWLTNGGAMAHPQASLYVEGFLWHAIAARYPTEEDKRRDICSAVERITREYGSSGLHPISGGPTSVNGETLDRLIALWRAHQLDPSLLVAIAEQRTGAKLLQLFQPQRLLRCAIDHQRTSGSGAATTIAATLPLHYRAIHSDILHQNTNTGRLASQAPCVHNMPKNALVRNLFLSRFGPEHGVMVEADYSQLEVVTLALLSGDAQMIQELKESVDFHCLRVSLMKHEAYADVVRKVKVDKDPAYIALRQLAKVFSFQRQYGAGVASIASTTGLSPQEVEALVRAEEAHYPQLTNYYRLVQSAVEATGNGLAVRYRKDILPPTVNAPIPKGAGAPATPAAFKEELPFRLRTVIEPSRYFPVVTGTKFDFSKQSTLPTLKNHPVQGFAGELVQMMCGKLVRHMAASQALHAPVPAPERGVRRDAGGTGQEPLAFLVNSVHDCVWLDCHASVASVVERDVRRIMESVCATLTDVYWNGEGLTLTEEERKLVEAHKKQQPTPSWTMDLPFPVTVHRGTTLGAFL